MKHNMDHDSEVILLAQSQSLGSVRVCSHGCVHLQIGRGVTILDPAEFVELVGLLNQSAAMYKRMQQGCGNDAEFLN